MSTYIKNPMPRKLAEQATAETNDILNLVRPFAAPLTGKEKTGLRTMAEGREDFVRLVAAIAVQHEQDLPRADNPQMLVRALDTDEFLEGLRQATLELSETIADIQISNSADIMLLVDAYVESLQAARKRSAALNLAMGEIDEWNKRYSTQEPNKTAE